MSLEGRRTKTPELKQSGHPASGAADNSSLSNSSSTFCRTYNAKYVLNMIKQSTILLVDYHSILSLDFVCDKTKHFSTL